MSISYTNVIGHLSHYLRPCIQRKPPARNNEINSVGCSGNLNVVFGLYKIGGDSRQNVTDFIRYMGSALEKTSRKVRLGIYEQCGNADLKLQQYDRSRTFRRSVTSSMTIKMSTLLYNIRRWYTPSRFDNIDSDTFVILLVSGTIDDIKQASIEANRLKYKARVAVVGVDDSVDRYDLVQLASYRTRSNPDVSHVLPVHSPNVLPKLVKKIQALMICSRI